MIDEIQVKNLALIREATLVPGAGLTVLTGETGAGKTAVVSALKLLAGGRADKDSVRDGADALEVSGRFFDTHGDELVIRRSVSADGRSRASLNGGMASMRELSDALEPQVDLCGQHDQQQLLKPSNHLGILDAWISVQEGNCLAETLAAYQKAYDDEKAAWAAYERVVSASTASSAKLDEARFVLKRVGEVDPQPGEYEELTETLSRAENAEELVRAAYGSYEALSGEGGANDALNSAISALEQGARHDAKLGDLAQSLREASYTLEDVAREVRSYQDSVEFDPETLQAQQERMAALQGLLHSFGPRMEDVFAARDAAADAVSMVDDAGHREKVAMREAKAAYERKKYEAINLDNIREAAAPQFAQAVTAQMQRMEMQGASLQCALTYPHDVDWSRMGRATVEFMFCPGEGMQARPLARIASGGEISRVMLAIKVVLGAADPVDTLVFDEVDAGVGGTAAVALADILANLAKTHQVIVVTHLAQVAVRAQVHVLVEKRVDAGGMPETVLRQLTREERPAEIARMMSGSVTETSLAHARELLANK